ncbi:MAG: NAD(P)-dependent malic enzyme, partial [Anaerotignaceae bacterium]
EKLKEKCDIPIFHDDQHGTAIVTLAGIINSLKLVGKKKEDVKVLINGAGSAGVSICKLLLSDGFKNIIMCDRTGAIYTGRAGVTGVKAEMAEITNKDNVKGNLADVIKGIDVFIGVSSPKVLTVEMVSQMNKDAIIFACANPTPEIFPEDAIAGGARVIATGRSDFPNQINNVLAFPGVFRGTFDVCATTINEEMKIAAAYAIASLIKEEDLKEEYIIPNPLDRNVTAVVAAAVAQAAVESNVATKTVTYEEEYNNVRERLKLV